MGNSKDKRKYDYVIPTSKGWKPVKDEEKAGTRDYVDVGLYIKGKAKLVEEELQKVDKQTEGGRNKVLEEGLGVLKEAEGDIGRDIPLIQEGLFKMSKTLSRSNVRNIGSVKRRKGDITSLDNYYTGTESYVFVCVVAQWDRKRRFNKQGFYVISNLSEFVREISPEGHILNRERVKQALFKGNEEMIVSIVKDGVEMLQKIRLFEMTIYRKIDGADRMELIKQEEYEEALKDTKAILEIWVKPSEELRRDMRVNEYGDKLSGEELKKLGLEGGWNTLVSASMLPYYQSLSDLGKRLFMLTLKLNPETKISLRVMIGKKHLNMGKKDIEKKGYKRIREEVAKELDKFKADGHLGYLTYNKKTDMFWWKCTDKLSKHPCFLEDKKGKQVSNTEILEAFNNTKRLLAEKKKMR